MLPDDPRHGTKAGYEAGCRSDCCKRAQMRYQNQWRMTGPRTIDHTGTRRRIEALQTLGYSTSELSKMLGHERTYLRKMLTKTQKVQRSTARKIAALYDELCMKPVHDPAGRTLGWNGSREQTRRRALAQGFLPPLAWDNIDDPDEQPNVANVAYKDTTYLDEAAIERRMNGDRGVRLTKLEAREVIRRLYRRGYSTPWVAEHTGLRPDRYLTIAEFRAAERVGAA